MQGIRPRPTHVKTEITAFEPAQISKAFPERLQTRLPIRIALLVTHQHPDPSHTPVLLLGFCRHRPRAARRRGYPAKPSNEIAPPHAGRLPHLLDDLISKELELLRYVETERRCRFEVDHQLELSGELY